MFTIFVIKLNWVHISLNFGEMVPSCTKQGWVCPWSRIIWLLICYIYYFSVKKNEMSHFVKWSTNNLNILIPWSCWIQNGLHPTCHVCLGELGVIQGHQVHTNAYMIQQTISKLELVMIILKTLNLISILQPTFSANNKRIFFQILMSLTKKVFVIKNYRQCLKSKIMFMLENDIALLVIGYTSLLRHEIEMTK